MMLKISISIELGRDVVDLFCLLVGEVMWTDFRIITA
jgi:hypothetical protein